MNGFTLIVTPKNHRKLCYKKMEVFFCINRSALPALHNIVQCYGVRKVTINMVSRMLQEYGCLGVSKVSDCPTRKQTCVFVFDYQ